MCMHNSIFYEFPTVKQITQMVNESSSFRFLEKYWLNYARKHGFILFIVSHKDGMAITFLA